MSQILAQQSYLKKSVQLLNLVEGKGEVLAETVMSSLKLVTSDQVVVSS